MGICSSRPKTLATPSEHPSAFAWGGLPTDVQDAIIAKLTPLEAARVALVDRHMNRLVDQAPQWEKLLLAEHTSGLLLQRPRQHVNACLNNLVTGEKSRAWVAKKLNTPSPPQLRAMLDTEALWQAQLRDWQSDEGANNPDVKEAANRILAARLPETTVLNLSHLSIRTLPACIGRLAALQGLSLEHCDRLTALPDTIGQLKNLAWFSLDHCSRLKFLPDAIGGLTALRWLSLAHCHQLESLPGAIGRLRGLRSLCLSHCEHLAALPKSVDRLAALRELYLDGCRSLKLYPELMARLRCQIYGLPDNFTGWY